MVVASCTCDYSSSESDRGGFFALSRTRRISTTNHERKNVENLSGICLFLVIAGWPWRPLGRPGSLGFGCISVFLGVAAGGFALTATHFSRRRKVSKRLGPGVRPARWGSGFLRSGIDPGAAPTVCFAAPPLAVFGFAKRSLRSHPRINPSTQPAEGASTARSRAAAELTLILLSGEKRGWGRLLICFLWSTARYFKSAYLYQSSRSVPSPFGRGLG